MFLLNVFKDLTETVFDLGIKILIQNSRVVYSKVG